MKRRARLCMVLSALTLLLTSILSIGCGSTTVKLDWSESTLPGRWHADYTTFEGVEQTTLRVQGGQTLGLNYDVNVEKGLLTLRIVDPDGESQWAKSFDESADGQVTLTAPQQGRYQLCVEGDGAGGSFDLSWRMAE